MKRREKKSKVRPSYVGLKQNIQISRRVDFSSLQGQGVKTGDSFVPHLDSGAPCGRKG